MLALKHDDSKKIELELAKNFIAPDRQYLFPILSQETLNFFDIHIPEESERERARERERLVSMIIMDSFAELTDKLFVNKRTGSCILCHWKDLEHSEYFESLYDYHGLLPIDKLKHYYDEFFTECIRTYGEIPIIFINFPTTLDSRQQYKERGHAIEQIIDELSGAKFHNIIPVKADFVEKNPNDDFVYHFSEKTYISLALKIADMKLPGISFRSYRVKLIQKKIYTFLTKLIPVPGLRRSLRQKVRENFQ